MSFTAKTLDKRFTLIEAERRFKRSCEQIVLLNQRMADLKKRYKSAKTARNRVFQCKLRRNLAIVDSTRSMFHDYARTKAELVADLRAELFGEPVEIYTG